jgi:thiamine-phosphate pyrophosphorylase
MPRAESAVHAERLARFASAGLYLVTSQVLSAGRTTPQVVAAALAGGCRLFQLREKELPLHELVAMGREVRALTRAAGALLLVNDRLDVAMAVGADGVHLGRDDFPVAEARRLAPDMIIGASSHTLAQGLEAAGLGASYVNIGPVFQTQTKVHSAGPVGVDAVAAFARHVPIPFTVMGGIKPQHVAALAAAGARTFAVVTAVTADPAPEAATRRLLQAIRAAAG